MRQLRHAIVLIAATIAFASPCAAELSDNNGTMIPFAATREEWLKNNDPRLSMAERYPNGDNRAAAIVKATRELARNRLALEEDAGLFIANSD
jgi:hypothetical protein